VANKRRSSCELAVWARSSDFKCWRYRCRRPFPAVAIDERHFFRRIDLRNGAHTSAQEKAQVFVRFTVHVGVKKRRVSDYEWRPAGRRPRCRSFPLSSNAWVRPSGISWRCELYLSMLKRGGGLVGVSPWFPRCGELRKLVGGETKHHFREVFLGRRTAARRTISSVSRVATGLSVENAPGPRKRPRFQIY